MSAKNLNNDPLEEVLNSLNGIQRASAPPFLATKILAAVDAEPTGLVDRLLMMLAKPSFAFGSLLLILALNASILFWQSGSKGDAISQEVKEEVADEYSLAITTFYDYSSK
jgi:hypothetical protein